MVIDHRDAMEFINCELMLDRPATVMGGWGMSSIGVSSCVVILMLLSLCPEKFRDFSLAQRL